MRFLALCTLLLLVFPVQAQTNCGGLPCGSIPWAIPQFPDLRSPTPLDSVQSNLPEVPTSTPTSTATTAPTAYATVTPFMDTANIQDNVATLQAIFDATPIAILDAQGTPVSIDQTIASNGALFFSYARGFTSNSFGVFSPIIDFILFVLLLTLTFTLIRISLPVLAAIIGAIRKIIVFILEFVPG